MACGGTCGCGTCSGDQPCGSLGARRFKKREERKASGLASQVECRAFRDRLEGVGAAEATETDAAVLTTSETTAAESAALEPAEEDGARLYEGGTERAPADEQALLEAAAIGAFGILGLGLLRKALRG